MFGEREHTKQVRNSWCRNTEAGLTQRLPWTSYSRSACTKGNSVNRLTKFHEHCTKVNYRRGTCVEPRHKFSKVFFNDFLL